MRYLPDWLRRQRAQQLVNFNRVRKIAAAETGRLVPTSYPLSPFWEVADAYVAGRPAVACRSLDPPFDIIAESVTYPALELNSPAHHGMMKRFLRNDLRDAIAQPLDLAICLGPVPQLYDAFWHWNYENLLKVVLAEEVGFTGVYLVPPQPYARETLELIGIDPKRIVVNPPGLWKVKRLWVWPHVPGDRLLRYPGITAKLRAALLSNIGLRNVTPKKTGARVYISRNRPGVVRSIVNEEPFKQLIARWGFSEYFAEDHSVAAQVEYFAGAEAMIGSHGAGFVHALVMPEGSLVVPLYSPLRHEVGGTIMAARLLKHRFYPLMPYVLKEPYRYGDDVEANLDLIEVTLERELGAAR